MPGGTGKAQRRQRGWGVAKRAMQAGQRALAGQAPQMAQRLGAAVASFCSQAVRMVRFDAKKIGTATFGRCEEDRRNQFFFRAGEVFK
jgi:hypothetical protein